MKSIEHNGEEPVRLQASCKCYANTLTVQVASPDDVLMLACHCAQCRKHSAAAWGVYLYKGMRDIALSADELSHENKGMRDIAFSADELARRGPTGFEMEKDVHLPNMDKKNLVRKISVRCDGLVESGTAEKWLCRNCHSTLGLLVPERGFFVSGGLIDDGDYSDARKGRIPAPDLWPQLIKLGSLDNPIVDLQYERRAPWYGQTAEALRAASEKRKSDAVLLGRRASGGRSTANETSMANVMERASSSTGTDRTLSKSENRSASKDSSGEGAEVVTGGCYCGACRYHIYGTFPRELQHCYCSWCRKLSGGLFQTWAPVLTANPSAALAAGNSKTVAGTTGAGAAVVEGLVWNVTDGFGDVVNEQESPLLLDRTSQWGSRHVCRKCGTVLSIVYDSQPGVVWIAAGSYDDSSIPGDSRLEKYEFVTSKLARAIHICCLSKQPWYELPEDGLPRIRYAG
ncbi:unnamed protein product [Amoebophrya sp. A120]|nr:unnamed protein product [Amoebophrya sp. A120]|eukprot:GSA120T00025804001.1